MGVMAPIARHSQGTYTQHSSFTYSSDGAHSFRCTARNRAAIGLRQPPGGACKHMKRHNFVSGQKTDARKTVQAIPTSRTSRSYTGPATTQHAATACLPAEALAAIYTAATRAGRGVCAARTAVHGLDRRGNLGQQ
jgi:hypothetical protein